MLFPQLRNLLFLFLFTFSITIHAQEALFTKVDAHAASYKETFVDVPTLAKQLTEPFETDKEKARALFMWLAHNVRYDCKKFHNPQRPDFRARSQQELEEMQMAYRQKNIAKTAKLKRGVCQDYSDLFKAMCDEVGLEAVVISGDARNFQNPFRNAHNNPHAWNAVKLDGEWYLLDATWGAGFTDGVVKKFTRKVTPGFFMTPPNFFAQNHLPDDPKWQLLDQPFDKKSFRSQPVVNYAQEEFPFTEFSNEIKEKDGKKEIRFKMSAVPKYFMLATSSGRPVKFTQAVEDGFQVFRFSSRSRGLVIVYGGNNQKKMQWLAKYDL